MALSDNISKSGHPVDPDTADSQGSEAAVEEIAFRCRHFRNDRPCSFHKKEGVHCSSCPHRDLADQRILVIKLDSPGDVLRTTCLLPSLKRTYPGSYITWMTREAGRPLLENNPAIDRLVEQWEEMFTICNSEYFHVAINPDANPQAARLLEMVNADAKLGMGWSAAGHVICYNQEAEQWLRMGLFDDLKRENTESYQRLIHRLCRLELVDPRPLLYLTDQERRSAEEHLQSLGLDRQRPVIGINTGAGPRWPQKSWTVDHQIGLIHLIQDRHPAWQVLLLGGPEESEKNRLLQESCEDMAITASPHPVREFAALVQQTHVLVTADTLALHIGLATARQIVALFGPTSRAEIDMCGLGEKLSANLECLGCYRTDCDRSPNCMELLAPETVRAAIERRLQKTGSPWQRSPRQT
ncbi:MAG: glycosyltransferase family 9 protein [Syntrophobacteria bacterium]